MVHSAGHSLSRLVRRGRAPDVGPVDAAFCASIPVSAQVVAAYSFADGTAAGWVSFNGASTPIASNTEAFSGSSFSLATTANSSGAEGREE